MVCLAPADEHHRMIWDDHLATAIPNPRASTTKTIDSDRGCRWWGMHFFRRAAMRIGQTRRAKSARTDFRL